MAALDLLGRRWTLRVLWELREGPLGFRELQSRCDGMSPSVLSQRLSELVAARILQRHAAQEYTLAPEGEKLLLALGPLNEWAANWSKHIDRPGDGSPPGAPLTPPPATPPATE